MQKKINALAVYLVLSTLLGCAKENSKGQNLRSGLFRINLAEAINSRSEPPVLSSYFSKIEYIQLETSENALVKGNARVYATSEYIYTVAFRQILQFNRSTGRFIKEIGHYGDDPEGYLATLPDVPPIEENSLVVLTGKYVKQIDAENNITGIAARVPFLQGFASLDSGLFVGYISNFDCKQEHRLVIYSKDGDIVKKFINHQNCDKLKNENFVFDFSEGDLYNKDSEVFFKETYNDTIFKVTKDSLIKHAYFDLGRFSIPYKDKLNLSTKEVWDKVSIYGVFESENYIFFNYKLKNSRNFAVYDKHNQITFVPDDLEIENGIKDDFNNFIEFKPFYANKNNEVVGLVQPIDVLDWFEKNKNLMKDLPLELRNLEKIRFDDNPIVAIATLR